MSEREGFALLLEVPRDFAVTAHVTVELPNGERFACRTLMADFRPASEVADVVAAAMEAESRNKEER